MSGQSLDLSAYTRGCVAQQEAFAQALLRELTQFGFVKLVHHGLSDEDVGALFDWTRKFFALPSSEKVRLAHPAGPEPQRGWSCVGAERTSKLYRAGLGETNIDEERFDAREHFDLGPPDDRAWPNRWPDERCLPGFQEFLERYYRNCAAVSSVVLAALEQALGLPAGAFRERCTHTASELRLNHYPAIEVEELRRGVVNRIWPHTDLGVITCLFQDGTGGLEMEDRASTAAGHKQAFLPVAQGPEGAPAEMIVSISETLQRWTNGRLPAAVHRVELAPHLKTLQQGLVPQRFSNAFFVKADREVSVAPLPQFLAPKTPALYEEMSALEYHRFRVAQAYRG
ncbi:isopenicillin N synthase family dioxygenase [Aspergillus aculeatinus CBS 121060]|uniref:Clavaminate synthase-like protein n=1 Tax=Aspergillus aculeatinus CBS 121060 TaxID=1448322 RepID=A0ACD1H7A3_9EURO|nr:Clavaminate synthase-like protein [Aspergillus aculeatinus CBS 121060]RAH69292.1 Clavaminate synthase-like protein [Aspergillus aculeatinus CBS 121060]